ncbi:MAG: hypothetical protein AB1403_25085 [Candidatus Riflebacteria bacterium]
MGRRNSRRDLEKNDLQSETTAVEVWKEFIAGISIASERLFSKALLVLSGSFLLTFHGDYPHPKSFYGRLVFTLLLPAWGLMFLSIYKGMKVAGNQAVGALFQRDEEHMRRIAEDANKNYNAQRNLFFYSLAFLGTGLIVYLLWWIYCYDE